MTAKRRPADVLREARKRDSLAKRTRVLAIVDDLKATGEPITFLGVAKAARVSNWLVYAEGVREHIEAARKSQHGTQRHERKAGATASSASLTTDLELTRAELRKIRDERDRLKAKVQRGLGQQVDQTGSAELVTRINELLSTLQQRDIDLTSSRAEATRLATELEAALDEVGGLRRALKQMTRQQNTAG
jgi:chromosome segregation ATPase